MNLAQEMRQTADRVNNKAKAFKPEVVDEVLKDLLSRIKFNAETGGYQMEIRDVRYINDLETKELRKRLENLGFKTRIHWLYYSMTIKW